jgi:hypothetical protein
MAEVGPQDAEGNPTGVLPDFTTGDIGSCMQEIEDLVAAEAKRREPEIDAEVVALYEGLAPEAYTFEADGWPEGDYRLSWEKPSTTAPIKVASVRLPSPQPRKEVDGAH